MRALADILPAVVARIARCFQAEDPRIDPEFWENMHGPMGDSPDDWGMFDYWTDPYEDA